MAHTLSASSVRSNQLSPSGLALAALLHGLVAAALWWMSQNPQNIPPPEQPIEVTIEQPKPEPPKPEPPKPEPPKPEPPKQAQPMPEIPGLRPPAEITAEKPTQVPPKPEQQAKVAPTPVPEARPEPPPPPQVADAPAVAALEPPKPEAQRPAPPKPETPKPEPPKAEPPKASQPHPPDSAPGLRPPAPSTAEKPSQVPPKPKPPAEQHAYAMPPPPAPSPLTPLSRPPAAANIPPQRRPPAVAHGEAPSTSAFVNPADVYTRARISDNYLWQVVRKLAGYTYNAQVTVSQSMTVVQIVVARDGRLLDVTITRSSGYPQMDSGVVAGVRSGSPYAPLPPEIKGESATFSLPLVSSVRR